VGSSPLEVVGIRNSTDIDITIAARFLEQFGAGVTHLCDWLDIVTETYSRSHRRAPIADDELIYDAQHHFWYRGFKFASTDIVLERKAFQARPTDLADVEAWKRFFAQSAANEPLNCYASENGTGLISFLIEREKELKSGRL
jgi:hypothetical protein